MASFADQLRAFEAQAASSTDAVVREVVLEVGKRVVARTPRDTGRLSSNWRYGLTTPDLFASKVTNEQRLQNTEEIPKAAAGFVHWITNAVEYAYYVEVGANGRMPAAMVGATQTEFPQILRAAIIEVATFRGLLRGAARAEREGLL